MDLLSLLTDLHADGARQGPGSPAATLQALALARAAGLSEGPLKMADLGCGTGASTTVLATALRGSLTALDLIPAFLARLEANLARLDTQATVSLLEGDMNAPPFEAGALDLLWSEGAIYNLGFRQGLQAWRPLLKLGGFLAVSELTWLTATRPSALTAHWEAAYPEVGTAGAKLQVLEEEGFRPVGYFPLGPDSWLENYYHPLEARFPAFLTRHAGEAAAEALIAEERAEIALYRTHQEFVSYGFYIAQRCA